MGHRSLFYPLFEVSMPAHVVVFTNNHTKARFFSFFVFVVFRYRLNQNNSTIQLINLASLIFLDFDVIFMRLQNLGTLG